MTNKNTPVDRQAFNRIHTKEKKAQIEKEMDEFIQMINDKEDDSLTPLGRETRAFSGSYRAERTPAKDTK